MANRPAYGQDKMPLIGFIQRVKTQARTVDNEDLDLEQSELTHFEQKERFRFNIVNNEYKKKAYAELMANFKLKDSSVMIRTYANIDFNIDEKITTNVDLGGLISGQPLVKSLTHGYSGRVTRRETIIIIDG